MEYIHKDFNLAHVLKYGIAFHHGSLPLFIRKRIEDLYSSQTQPSSSGGTVPGAGNVIQGESQGNDVIIGPGA